MALLKFISLSVGSLLLFQGAYAEEGSGNTAEAASDCLDTMNAARQEVGLPNFTTPATAYFGEDQKEQTLTAICEDLLPSTVSRASEQTRTTGTVAYYEQATKNCSEAVAKWKLGFSAFRSYTTSPPPPFEADESAGHQLGATPYNTVEAINFAALYSAKDSAKAECAFVTCTGTDNSRSTTTPAKKAMVCITYPEALTVDEAPWSQEQWNKILAALDPSFSSANAAVPTLLALAAAAVGVALM